MRPLRRHGNGYHFVGDPDTGLTVRWGGSLSRDPYRAPWPELADISISNRCTKGCAFCYRDSRPDGPLMTLDAYRYALECLTSPVWGPVFQVALGGGEPLEHPDFLAILDITRSMGIVANFTTNGDHVDAGMARALRGRVGAVALSAPDLAAFDGRALSRLRAAGIRTNLHFILSRRTLPQAVEILEGRFDPLLEGVTGIVFLTHKPRGRAGREDCLEYGSPLMERFLALARESRSRVPVGFDACLVPPVLRHGCADPRTVDACECGFFSVYVDEGLDVKPCSFAPTDADTWNLMEWDFRTIWDGFYESYRRDQAARACATPCHAQGHCRGVCPHFPEIAFCHTSALEEPWKTENAAACSPTGKACSRKSSRSIA
jgi:MoaA/NifB/PqqE/SkfB family radical SAM enzyme